MRKLIVCALFALATAILYVFTGLASSLLFLLASFILPGVALLLAAFSIGGVSVALLLPASVQKGQISHGTLLVENLRPIPIVRLKMMLKVNNTLTGYAENIPLEFSVGPHETKEIKFAFESIHCGQFIFSCTEVRIFDFLGLRGIRKSIQLQTKRLVLPETFPLQVQLFGSENSHGNCELFSVARKGQDPSEPFQLRDYVEGDSRKQIHWKLSQKLDRYIVADHSIELERTLLIIWDSGALPSMASPQVLDTLAEALISICIILTTDDIPYSIAWKNGETREISLKNITAMDDLYDTIPCILSTSVDESGISVIPDCLRALNGKGYPLIAYFAGKAPRELEELSNLGKTTLFLCSIDGEIGAAESDTWLFTPENYKSTLRDVTI